MAKRYHLPRTVTQLTVADAAKALSVAARLLKADASAGAPRNKDGSLHLVRYAAWLVKEAASGA